MRILDLTTLYIDGGEGGVNTYLTEKAAYVERFLPGARHAIVTPGRRSGTARLGASTLHLLRSPRLPRNTQHRVLIDFPSVRRLIHEERPDVVEVDCSFVLGHVAARALAPRRVPIIGFYHVHLPLLYARPVRSFLRRHFTRRTLPFAWGYAEYCTRPLDRVVVASRKLLAELGGRRFPRLELVPLGVNLELFRPRGDLPRPRLPGIDPLRPVVLYVGRLSREKDLDVLCRAHEILHRRSGSQLVIAGDGPLGRQTRRFAARRPGVAYLGLCRYGGALADIYRAADVLAVPGRNETFSLISLEAFACGLPVVAVREGGPAEILAGERAPENGAPGAEGGGDAALGRLARPGDAEDFADKLGEVIGLRAGDWSCRRHVEENYSWEKTFERLFSLYRAAREEARGGGPARELAGCAARDRLACG
jgi:alpha-1,6-mannosyltransferase